MTRRHLLAPAVVMIALAAIIGLRWRSTGHRFLEVELRTSAGTYSQIYWDERTGYSDERSAKVPLERTPTGFQIVRFALPDHDIEDLRFDPTDAPGEILLKRMTVLDSHGAAIAQVRPANLLPFKHIASIAREPDFTRITTTGDGNDPFLLITVSCLQRPAAWYSLASVTTLSLSLAWMAIVAVIGASIWYIARDTLRPRDPAADRLTSTGRAVLPLLALMGLIVSGKLYQLHEFPSPVPRVDQWWAEAWKLFVPFSDGCLSWRTMFELHNEHRVFFTRATALALLLANGEWDPVLQQVVNATLHAFTGTALAATLWIATRHRRLDLITLACALAFAAPFSWENTTSGFQSAFYFLLLFSILGLWLTSAHPFGTRPWTLGWICVLCSLVTSAGGLLTATVAVAAVPVRAFSTRKWTRHTIFELTSLVAPLALGVASKSPTLAGHAALRAASFQEFLGSFTRNLAWPWVDYPWLFVVMWLPVSGVLVVRLARRRRLLEHEQWLTVLAMWIVLQAAALALGRGAGSRPPSSRYMDFLCVGLVVNAVALTTVLDAVPTRTLARYARAVGVTAWLVLSVTGVDHLTRNELGNAAVVSRWEAAYGENLTRFVATDDIAALTTKRFPEEVPFYDPLMLANAWLRHPYVRQILPPAIREPMRLQPALVTNQAFAPNGFYQTTPFDPLRLAWGSYTARLNPSQGRFESVPMPACHEDLLKFDVAGYLGEPGLSLAIQDVASGRETPIRTSELARERWLSAFTPCPGAPFKVVAVDANSNFWFAFRSPVELGWGSRLAEHVVMQSRSWLVLAIGLAVLAVRFGQYHRNSHEPRDPVSRPG